MRLNPLLRGFLSSDLHEGNKSACPIRDTEDCTVLVCERSSEVAAIFHQNVIEGEVGGGGGGGVGWGCTTACIPQQSTRIHAIE